MLASKAYKISKESVDITFDLDDHPSVEKVLGYIESQCIHGHFDLVCFSRLERIHTSYLISLGYEVIDLGDELNSNYRYKISWYKQ